MELQQLPSKHPVVVWPPVATPDNSFGHSGALVFVKVPNIGFHVETKEAYPRRTEKRSDPVGEGAGESHLGSVGQRDSLEARLLWPRSRKVVDVCPRGRVVPFDSKFIRGGIDR